MSTPPDPGEVHAPDRPESLANERNTQRDCTMAAQARLGSIYACQPSILRYDHPTALQKCRRVSPVLFEETMVHPRGKLVN